MSASVTKVIRKELSALQVHEALKVVFAYGGKQSVDGDRFTVKGFNNATFGSCYTFVVTFNVAANGGKTLVTANARQGLRGLYWLSFLFALVSCLWFPVFLWTFVAVSKAKGRVERELEKGLEQVAEQLT